MRALPFLKAWVLATAPVVCLAEIAHDEYLNQVHFGPLGYWLPLLPYWAAFAWAMAWLQAKMLRRHREPIPRWVVGMTAVYATAALAFVGLQEHWWGFIGQFGAVKLPSWWFWIYAGVTVFSGAAILGVGEAAVLWGRRWLVHGRRWIALRLGLALLLFGAFLPFELYAQPLVGMQWGLYRYRFLVSVVSATLTAALTAWMLDRFYFRRGDAVADLPARP